MEGKDSSGIREPKKVPGPRRLLKALRSVKLAVTLLFLIALVLIVATVIRDQAHARRYIYHSWWFISLLSLFCVNLLVCTAGRWSFKVKKLGTTVTHTGVLMMVVGVVIGSVRGERGFVQVSIGDSDNMSYLAGGKKIKLPFVVHLEDFKVERYRDRGVRERLVVYVVDRDLVRSIPLELGKTFKLAGTPYSVTTLRYEPDFVVLGRGKFGSRSDEPDNPAVQVRVEGGSDSGLLWVFAKVPGMHQDPNSNVRLLYQRIERIKDFKSKVVLFEKGRVVASKTIEVNKPLRYKGYSIYQSDYDEENESFSVLGITRDPGVPVVYAGFILISAGVLFTFYARPILGRKKAGG